MYTVRISDILGNLISTTSGTQIDLIHAVKDHKQGHFR